MPTSTPTKFRRCAYPTCPVQVKTGVLACREHWGALTSDLRERLVDAWERRKAHPDVPELVMIHRALLMECMRQWDITPEMAAEAMQGAPKVVQTACPWCGAPSPLHRPGCQRLL